MDIALSLTRSTIGKERMASSGPFGRGRPAQTAAVADPGLPDDLPALARAAVAGEPGAFGLLYQRYVDRVHRFIYFRVSDEATARDLTQDAFVRALRKIDSLSQPERFEAWLMRIAHRAVQNHYRSRGRRPEQVEIEKVEHAQTRDRALGVGASSAGDADPHRRLETAIRLDDLREAIAGLSEAQREVLGLRFVAGLSFAETAEATGKSLHAVRKLQYRGLASLRQQASDEAEEGSP